MKYLSLGMFVLVIFTINLASADEGQIISQTTLNNYQFSYSDFEAHLRTLNGNVVIDCSKVKQSGECILPIDMFKVQRRLNSTIINSTTNETDGTWLGDYIIVNGTYNLKIETKPYLQLYAGS